MSEVSTYQIEQSRNIFRASAAFGLVVGATIGLANAGAVDKLDNHSQQLEDEVGIYNSQISGLQDLAGIDATYQQGALKSNIDQQIAQYQTDIAGLKTGIKQPNHLHSAEVGLATGASIELLFVLAGAVMAHRFRKTGKI